MIGRNGSLRIALAMLSVGVCAFGQNPANIAGAAHGFVVGVTVKNGKAEPATFASGVFISERHIVTQLGKCCSAAEGVQIKGYVVTANGQNSIAQPIWSSKEKLIAVFELEKPIGTTAATLAPLKLLQQGQAVFAFGLKDGKPLPVEGTIAGVVSMKGTEAKLLQVKLSGETHQGSALFDACGNTAGIILGTGQSGDTLALAVDEWADAIAATKSNPQIASGACAVNGGGGGGGGTPGEKSGPPSGGKTPSKQEPQQQAAPADTLKYTLILVAVLLVLAFTSRRGREEVAKVVTSRKLPALAIGPQGFVQPNFGGQMQRPQMAAGSGGFGYVAPGGLPRLRGVSGYYAGNMLDMENRAWILGRDQRVANIVFPPSTETVSKKHCTVWYDANRGVFVVEDHGSTNGTWVGYNEALTPGRPRDLRPGERFYVGDQTNVFEVVLE